MLRRYHGWSAVLKVVAALRVEALSTLFLAILSCSAFSLAILEPILSSSWPLKLRPSSSGVFEANRAVILGIAARRTAVEDRTEGLTSRAGTGARPLRRSLLDIAAERPCLD